MGWTGWLLAWAAVVACVLAFFAGAARLSDDARDDGRPSRATRDDDHSPNP